MLPITRTPSCVISPDEVPSIARAFGRYQDALLGEEAVRFDFACRNSSLQGQLYYLYASGEARRTPVPNGHDASITGGIIVYLDR